MLQGNTGVFSVADRQRSDHGSGDDIRTSGDRQR